MKTYNYITNIFRGSKSAVAILALFLTSLTAQAQPQHFNFIPNVAPFSPTTANSFPFNINTATGKKVQWILLPGDFASPSPATPGLITNLWVYKLAAGTTSATHNTLTIKFAQTVAPPFFTTGTWYPGPMTTALAATTALSHTGPGWVNIPLATPFLYDPTQCLIIEISQCGYTGTGFSLNQFSYTTSPGFRRMYSDASSLCGVTPLPTGGDRSVPGFGITLTSVTPCTNPPTAGTATATPATLCGGSSVSLNLTGHTAGTGQTYQWQRDIGGGFVTISGVLTSPGFTDVPPSNASYQCIVTCGVSNTSAPASVTVTAGLSGTYTINSAGGGNFLSFSAAAAALSCGITGPVTFNVAPGSGPYTEQVSIPVVPGASAVNTITFNGNGRTLQFAPVTGARHILKLDGADFVTINNLNIVGLAPDFGWGIHLINTANNNTIDNCTINMNAVTSITASASGGIIASGSTTSATTAGNNASNLTITGCTITGGYHGIVLNGVATGLNAVNNIITNNIVEDSHGNGIHLLNNDGALVQGNNISRPSRTTMLSGSAGIELGTGNKNVVVNANRIHNTHDLVITQSGSSYGVYLNSCDALAGVENRVTNNLIYNFNSLTGLQYGLYNIGSDGVRYYHNTVVLDNAASTSGTTYAFHQTTLASNIELKNNILYVKRGGTGTKNCIRLTTTTSTVASNNNALYMNSPAGTNGIGFHSINYPTLALWQTANGGIYDLASVDADPLFVSPGSGFYQISNTAIESIGANLGVLTDITGAPRGTTPDPGAYEWTPVPCSGFPSPGNTVASANPVCPGTAIILSLQNQPTEIGITYQWQTSSDGSTWFNASGASTSSTYSTSQSSATYYQCIVTCTNTAQSTISNPLLVGLNSFLNCYCVPGYTTGCTFPDVISNVTFQTINNTTGLTCTALSPPGYNPVYTTPNPSINQGASYPISVTTDGDDEGVAVWVDWNQNGLFEASELIFSQYSGLQPAIYTGTVTVPCTALLGTTVMRVRATFAAAPTDPCASVTFGETEDYYVTVTPTSVVASVGTIEANPALNCGPASQLFLMSVTSFTGNLTWQFFDGLSWITIAGAVNNPQTLFINGLPAGFGTISFDIRARATDCLGGDFASNVVTITQNDPVAPTGVTGGARCGPGDISLTGTPAAGHDLEWWSASALGTVVGTNSPFVYNAAATTTLYAASKDLTTGCSSSIRVPASATVHDIPVTTASNNGPFCVPATVGATAFTTFTATGSVANVNAELQSPLAPNNGSSVVGIEIENTSSAPIVVHYVYYASSASLGTNQVQSAYYTVGPVNCINQGNITTNPAWILIGSATAVSAGPYPALTQFPLDLNITVPPGMRYSFAVGGTGIRYEGTGTVCLTAPVVSDANITIWPAFGGTLASQFLHRRFVGKVTYSSAGSTNFTWNPAVTCITPDCSQGTANLAPSGTPYEYTVTITDNNNCSSTASTSVVVNQMPAIPTLNGLPLGPSVGSNPNLIYSTESNTCNKQVFYNLVVTGIPTPTVTYVFGGATSGSGSGDGSGSYFERESPSGITTVTVTAVNSCGTITRQFRVTVHDNTYPVINTTAVPVTTVNNGACGSTVVVPHPTVANGGVTDNCPLDPFAEAFFSRSDFLGEFDPYPVGTTTVTWQASDAIGNVTTVTQDVVVTNNKPVVTSFATSSDVILVNGKVKFTVNFSDESGGGPYTVKFYKDKADAVPANIKTYAGLCTSSCPSGQIDVNTVESDSIQYTASVVSEPKVEVVDGCNQLSDQSPNTTIQYQVVAVAGGQWTTGGGSFVVPAGANNYAGLCANYGVVVKPASGGKYKGQLQLNIHIPSTNQDVNVHTDNGSNQDIQWDYLTISGCSLATFRGNVLLNGVSGYQVFVQQCDKTRDPAASNHLRIRVTHKQSGALIFDTQPGFTESITGNPYTGASLAAILGNCINNNGGGTIKVQPSNSNCTQRVDMFTDASDNLLQNVPNPFNGTTEIRFMVPQDGKYTLTVYNYLGQAVATLFDAEAIAGESYGVMFDGSRMESGVYTYTLSGEGVKETRRMSIIK